MAEITKLASDDALENALRAARELWYDEPDLREVINGLEPISELRQANEVTFVYEIPRAHLQARLPAGADENWHPEKV